MTSRSDLRSASRQALWGLFAAIVISGLGFAQSGRMLRARAVPFEKPPVIDGDLDEWEDVDPQILIERLDQVWRGIDGNTEIRWTGPDDGSASIRLAYDEVHLYVAGLVRDDELIYNEARWWRGDAIELFVDANTQGRGRDSTEGADLDDTQIFLMPYQSGGRRWGVVNATGSQTDGQFDGVQVAGRLLEDDSGYQFEAALPWINFYGFRLEDGGIGLHVALDDADRGDGIDGTYLSWDGQGLLYDRVQARGSLTLEDAGTVLERASESRRRTPWWKSVLGIVLRVIGAVLGIAGLFVVVPLLYRTFQVRRRWRTRTLIWIAGTLALAVLAVSGVIAWQRNEARDRLESIALTVEQLETDGALEHLLGGLGPEPRRGERLLELLTGESVELPPEYAFELIDLPGPDSDVSPLALRPGEPYAFDVHPRGPADRIEIELSVRLASEGISRVENEYFVPRAGRLALELEDGTSLELPQQGRFLLRRSRPPFAADVAAEAGITVARALEDGTTVDRLSLEIPAEYRSKAITRLVLQIHSPVVRADLYGIRRVQTEGPDRSPIVHTIRRGRPGATGIPSTIRGEWPPGPGLAIDRDHSEIDVPLDRPAAARAWLVLGASELDTIHSPFTDPLAVVTVDYGEGLAETVFPLYRGTHVVEERLDPGRPDISSESPIAYEWREDDGLHRFSIVEIPLAMAPLESLRIQWTAKGESSSLRLAALTLGRPETRADVPSSELLEVEGERIRLRSGILAEPGATHFSVFLSDRLVCSTFEPRRQRDLEGSSPPDDEAAFAGESGQSVRLRELGGEELFETIVRVGEGRDGQNAVGLYTIAKPSAWLERVRNWAGLGLLLLAVPFLILKVSAALTRLRQLRIKLLAAFTLTSLVPVLVSFVVLANLLESNHRKELMGQAEKSLVAMQDRLVRREAFVQELADGCWEVLVRELIERPADPRPLFEMMARGEMEDLFESFFKDRLGVDHPMPWVAVEDGRGGSGREQFFVPPEGPSATPMFELRQPGIYRRWGRSFILGRHEEDGEWLRLAIVLPIDGRELAELWPDEGETTGRAVLYSVRGFPAADSRMLENETELPEISREARHAIGELAVQGGPAVRLDLEGEMVVAYELIERVSGEPVGVLASQVPLEPMRLELLVAEVPVRDFFLVAGLFAVLVAVTVASVMTDRLTRPLLRLEKGAQEVSRGNLNIRVREDSSDEIGRLARTFNFMTASLDDRVRDLSSLNRGMKDLARHLDRREIVEVAVDFLVGRLEPTRIQILLWLRHGEEPEAYDWSERQGLKHRELPRNDERVLALLRESLEPRILGEAHALERVSDQLGRVGNWIKKIERLVLLPLPLSGPTHGMILIGFDAVGDRPEPDHNFLAATASQVAVALDNARLYRLAIIDPRTGLYTHAYFESRLAEELDRASENERPLSVLKISLDEAARLERVLGGERWRALVLNVLDVIRSTIRRLHLMATSGRGEYEVMLPETAPGAARRLARVISEAIRAQVKAPGKEALVISVGSASYPEDGASKEFVLACLDQRLMEPARPEEKAGEDGGGGATAGGEEAGKSRDRLRRLGAIFESPKMTELLHTCERIAPSNISVLIEGETGVGKEVLAELIHQLSERAQMPLIRVNCAAFPETLLESELFGYEKGAFTGAAERRIGRFEMANRGTLFLDEIGEISAATQVKLLRVLQERQFERLGGNETIDVDVRIIAATNRNLVEAIQTGGFREDLYYRLRVVSLVVPPLRERRDEIPALVRLFREQFNQENPKKPVRSISPRAMDRLFHHEWPGNVRELKNVMQRAMVLADGDIVQPEHLILEPGPRQLAATAPPPLTRSGVSRPSKPTAGSQMRTPAQAARQSLPTEDLSGLNPRQVRLLEYLTAAGRITNREYVEREGISERTGLRDIMDLVRRHYLVKRGQRKGAYYVLAGSDVEAED